MVQSQRVCLSLALGCALLAASPGGSTVFCVDTAAELETALDTAATNSQDDTIKLVQGTYAAPSGGFYHGSSEPYGLVIRGDYVLLMGSCLQLGNPSAEHTTIEGSQTNQLLRLDVSPGATATVRVEAITFSGGVYDGTGPDAGGLTVNVFSSSGGGTTEIVNNRFISNHTTGFGGGLAAATPGTLRVVGNLFIFNSAKGHGAASLTCNGTANPCLEVLNNTVVSNTFTSIETGGIRVGYDCTSCYVENNILWDNQSVDLQLEASCHVNHNDIGVMDGTPASTDGNLVVSPGFDGLLSYRLAPASPLVDAGTVRAGAALPTSDLDGHPRIAGAQIDIGAYERQSLFDDDFESGTTEHWSLVVP